MKYNPDKMEVLLVVNSVNLDWIRDYAWWGSTLPEDTDSELGSAPECHLGFWCPSYSSSLPFISSRWFTSFDLVRENREGGANCLTTSPTPLPPSPQLDWVWTGTVVLAAVTETRESQAGGSCLRKTSLSWAKRIPLKLDSIWRQAVWEDSSLPPEPRPGR